MYQPMLCQVMVHLLQLLLHPILVTMLHLLLHLHPPMPQLLLYPHLASSLHLPPHILHLTTPTPELHQTIEEVLHPLIISLAVILPPPIIAVILAPEDLLMMEATEVVVTLGHIMVLHLTGDHQHEDILLMVTEARLLIGTLHTVDLLDQEETGQVVQADTKHSTQ